MIADVVVVGAGLAGATAANLLAKQGKKVLVIEKRKHVGGNCFDYKNEHNITVHKYGPHIFHTNDKKVWDFANQFTEFACFQHQVLSYVYGQNVPFPINRDTINMVFGTNLNINEVDSFLQEEVKKAGLSKEPTNFEEAVISKVGIQLYQLFFKNYTVKQWDCDPKLLAPEVAARIPVRSNRETRYFSDQYQGIPQKGYTAMIANMLEHSNIRLLLGADYFEIREQIEAKLTIFSGKLDEFFNYCYGKLGYRSLNFQFKTLDKEQFQPVAVVNYPNDYGWTRITEFKHFLAESSEKTTLLYEYPAKEGEPLYVELTRANIERREQYMQEIGRLENTGEYIFVGRLAEYKYYNMDQVIGSVMEKLEKWGNNHVS